jgi:hypothetical protein
MTTSWASWFWDTAMDGVIGSVIGGLVTFLALWVTFRWERGHAADLAFLAECRRMIRETRELQKLPISSKVPAGTIATDVVTAWHAWSSDVRFLAEGVATTQPCFWALCTAAREQVDRNLMLHDPAESAAKRRARFDELAQAMLNVQTLLQYRVSDPSYFKISAQRCAELEEELRAGARLR